jgi:CheY-like chemotaxis protein
MTPCFHVLVATASGNLRDIICRVLGRNGYTTKPVSSAAAALEEARHSQYEAIVTDMHLPDCCGATLVGSLRRAGVDTPAILLVEEETPRVREITSRLGSTRCLAGPTDLDRLKAAIADACNGEAASKVAKG